ncbi:alpha beta hydrolase fold family [Moniliophthora roreri]|nr:alpha beta hydrolase fold family [Moniliophthora roreri]
MRSPSSSPELLPPRRSICRYSTHPYQGQCLYEYLGHILFNPGGHSGSGVDLIRNRGRFLETLLGSQFDVVGFDPRGALIIRKSTPISFCFLFQT